MRRVAFLRIVPFATVAFLIACAPTTQELSKDFVADPTRVKCYEPDSTRSVTREQQEKVFQDVEHGDSASFNPCDTNAIGMIRIRPKDSHIGGKRGSYVALGLNLAQTGLSLGLIIAQQNPVWILLPALRLEPGSGITYRIDYRDSSGAVQGRDLDVKDSAWFQDEERTRDSLLQRSSRQISTALFGIQYPEAPKPVHSWRITGDILPLLLSPSNGGVWIEPHFEKYLPGNFTLDVSPGAFFPFSKPDHEYALYAGPRRYFFGEHSGVFLGVEPYFEWTHYYGHRYSRVALPATFGFAWRNGRIVYGLDFGIGPAKVLQGRYKDPNVLVVGSLHVGMEF